MVAAAGLRQHQINNAELEQVWTSDFQRFCSGGSLARIPPENRGTGFRTRHGVDAVLKHQQPVGHTDPEGAAGATLPDHGGQNRHPQAEHLAQIEGNRLALALFLCQHTGVGARGVDEAEDRQAKAVGMFH